MLISKLNLVPFSENILRTSPQKDENNNKDSNGHLSKKGRRGSCLILNSFMVFIFQELLLLGRVTKNEELILFCDHIVYTSHF